jgi:hypothetical protein
MDMKEAQARMEELAKSLGQVAQIMEQRHVVAAFEKERRRQHPEDLDGWDMFQSIAADVFSGGAIELPQLPVLVEVESIAQVITLQEWLSEAITIWARLEAALTSVFEIPGITRVDATLKQIHERRVMLIDWYERIKDDTRFQPTVQ